MLAVPTLSGCGLLYGYGGFGGPFYPGPFPDEGAMPSPSIAAEYTTGSATIELDDGTTIELDEVGAGSKLDLTFGSTVRWTGDDGWQMTLMGGGASQGWGGPPMLQFDRLTDNQHWTSWDPSRCIVEVDVIDETAVRGTATCRGVEWMDALRGGMRMGMEPPKPIEGETWSGEITFEALPEGAAD
jgi:hypothetical protein